MTQYESSIVKKYLAIFRYVLVRTLEYRVEMILWIIMDAVPFLALFAVWTQLFSGSETLRGHSLTQTIQFYVLVMIINGISTVHFEAWRSEEIRQGKIDHFMSRPFSYLSEIFWKDFGAKLLYLMLFFPWMAILYWVLNSIFKFSNFGIQISQLAVFIGLLVLGYFINFMMATWIVLATFWYDRSQGLEHFKSIALTIFSGSLMPLSMMPEYLRNIILWLPFKFIYAVPIGVIQGTYTLSWQDFAYLFFLLGLMWLMTQKMWQSALYKYSSSG